MFDLQTSLTGGQYGLLLYFGVAFGAHASLSLLSKWRAHNKASAYEAVGTSDAPAATVANVRKPKTVVWSDASSVMKLTRNLLILGAICFYCFICEKAPIYPQGKRMEGMDYYWFFVGLFFVAGALSLQHSGTNKFMHREQTNEWKGWMQYVFIAYHYCHAEYVYKPVRVFVSTYVWMTGEPRPFRVHAFFRSLLRWLPALWGPSPAGVPLNFSFLLQRFHHRLWKLHFLRQGVVGARAGNDLTVVF
jgi:hypothetical protein